MQWATPLIHYEDEHMMVVEKPKGLLSRAGWPHESSVETVLRDSGKPVFRVCHRLDKQTTGLIAVAKTYDVMGEMKDQFMYREVDKMYLAQVDGKFPFKPHRITAPVRTVDQETKHYRHEICAEDDEGAKSAETYMQGLAYDSGNETSLAKFIPISGRSHQIRLHSSHLGHPLCNDSRYNGGLEEGIWDDNFRLHASFLGFDHPITEENIELVSVPPWLKISRSKDETKSLIFEEYCELSSVIK